MSDTLDNIKSDIAEIHALVTTNAGVCFTAIPANAQTRTRRYPASRLVSAIPNPRSDATASIITAQTGAEIPKPVQLTK